jgi:hypothetical protein
MPAELNECYWSSNTNRRADASCHFFCVDFWSTSLSNGRLLLAIDRSSDGVCVFELYTYFYVSKNFCNLRHFAISGPGRLVWFTSWKVVITSELINLWICDAWNGENQVKNGWVMFNHPIYLGLSCSNTQASHSNSRWRKFWQSWMSPNFFSVQFCPLKNWCRFRVDSDWKGMSLTGLLGREKSYLFCNFLAPKNPTTWQSISRQVLRLTFQLSIV